jgi:hypothetical protein
MKTKKVKSSLLVFFFFVGIAFILKDSLLPTKTEKNTSERSFCNREIDKATAAWREIKRVNADSNISYRDWAEANKIAMSSGETKKSYPNDSTVVEYCDGLPGLTVYHLDAQRKILSRDSIAGDTCYISSKKTSLEEFKKHYPYPFGK